MTFYEIFTDYIMVHFIDLTQYAHAEEYFYWIFFGVSCLLALFFFVLLPVQLCRWFINGGKHKKGRFL